MVSTTNSLSFDDAVLPFQEADEGTNGAVEMAAQKALLPADSSLGKQPISVTDETTEDPSLAERINTVLAQIGDFFNENICEILLGLAAVVGIALVATLAVYCPIALIILLPFLAGLMMFLISCLEKQEV